MAQRDRVGDLEICQDLPFQRREWWVQRMGWGVMLLIALAALTGVLGRGPLARATARSANGELILRYERAVHHGSPTQLLVRLPRASGQVGVWIDQRYLEGLQLEQIVPQPSSTASGAGRTTFFFQVQPDGMLLFSIESRGIGMRRGQLGLTSGTSLQFRQFVFP